MKPHSPFQIILFVMLALCLIIVTETLPVSAGDHILLTSDDIRTVSNNSPHLSAVWYVNSSNDDVDGAGCDTAHCSLREAVTASASEDTITFAENLSGSTITLSEHIWINKSLTIQGLGADKLTISGNQIEQDEGGVLYLRGDYGSDGVEYINVNISALTITDGRARNGGGVFNGSRSTLEMTDCVIGPNNAALDAGGGISNKYGTLALNRCTVWDNTQSGGDDPIGGGGIATVNSPAITMLINTTISDNHADNFGGGVLVWAGGAVNIVHSTISLNSAGIETIVQSGGGGVNNYISTVNIHNSIVAGNFDESPLTNGTNPDVSGTFSSQGGNLIGDGTGSSGWISSDRVGTTGSEVDPLLGALAIQEPGTTQTLPLLVGSPAIDAVACPAEINLDQRGVTRPQGSLCDIGAFEFTNSALTLTVLPETIPPGESGTFYIQQFTVSGTEKAVTWSWDDGGLEPYCDLNSGTPGRLICYINTPPPVGSYNFTINVAEVEGTLTGSRPYTLVINPRLVFTPETLPIGRLGQAYNQVVTVTGGAAPYTLTKSSGTLPEGIIFDEATDAFTGTPSESGIFNDIVISAVDQNGVTKLKTYSIEVLPQHLFTWSPTSPTSYQSTTFTAEPGFNYYSWSYGGDPTGDCDHSVLGSGQTNTWSFYGKGQYKVCLTMIKYSPYQSFSDEQFLTVTNYPPQVYNLYIDPYLSFPGQKVEADLFFGDIDGSGAFTCAIDWGDGTPVQPGTVNQTYWECTFPPHVYSDVGSYTASASIVDDEGASDSYDRVQNVVYLYADGADLWLTSNTKPTAIVLLGYAPLGTEAITFNLAFAPTHGSLSDLTFMDCKPHHSKPAAECKATVLYTPNQPEPGEDPYVGEDSFEFSVQFNPDQVSAPATKNLWLHSNTPPTANPGTATVLISGPNQLAIFGADIDEYDYNVDNLTFHIETPPSYGTLSFDEDPDVFRWLEPGANWYQKLVYTPNQGVTSPTDSFTFYVNDYKEDSEPARMDLNLYTPTTLYVNVNDDVVDAQGCNADHCSLREAVLDAEIGDTIDFTLELPNTITLTQAGGGELLINKNIRITGPGANKLTISAGFMDPDMNPELGFRVFHVFNDNWPMKAEISGLTIRDGRNSQGGGIYVDQVASLDLRDSVIGPNNIVSYAGGGVSVNYADLTMENCTVIGNHGTGSRGGAGVFLDFSDVTIINSTIAGNTTNNFGAGILADYYSDVTLIHSTISGNTANQDHTIAGEGGGGGIYVGYMSKMELCNTIVAGNMDLTDPSEHEKWPDVYGPFISLGGNLIGDGAGSTGWVTGDLVGSTGSEVDPLLGLLDVHSPGTTPTFPLQEGSPAIDAVSCAAGVTTDQRGLKRPQGIACDIGAFEVENPWKYLFLPLISR